MSPLPAKHDPHKLWQAVAGILFVAVFLGSSVYEVMTFEFECFEDCAEFSRGIALAQDAGISDARQCPETPDKLRRGCESAAKSLASR